MSLTAKKVYAILKRQISDMEAKLNSPIRYRGTVATADLLPLNPDIGDMYNIESKSIYGEAGMNVAWNGVVWDTMGAPIDMSLYFTKEEAEAVIQRLVTEYLEKNPVKPGATTEQAQQIEQNKTDIGSLKTETNSLKEDISNKITKFYASNQGEAHITDSDNGKIQDMMIYGKSEQFTTTGKNLLKIKDGTQTTRGVTVTAKDGVVALKGTATETGWTILDIDSFVLDGTCILSANTHTNVVVVLANKSFGAVLEQNKSNALENAEASKVCFTVTEGKTYDISNILIQIEKGSVATSYEPYTGGIPSPSPDYPQEIKSVVNPTVKVCGKNLLNLTLQTTTMNGVTCTANGDGTCTLNGTSIASTDFYIYGDWNTANSIPLDSQKTYIVKKSGNENIQFHVGIPDIYTTVASLKDGQIKNQVGISFVICRVLSGVTLNNFTIYPQIEEGSVSTDFQPYHEQAVALPYTLNAIPVESGGNVTIDGQQYIADYVDVERGKVVRNVENVTFNGAENENWELWNADKEKIWSFMFVNSLKTFTNGSVSKCNRFEFNANESIDRTFWLCNPSGMPSLQIKNRIIGKDITAFKSWLSNNPINVIYPLRIPIEEELTAEHAQALKELATYYPVTNISIGSEQLDGYTAFNYPISMANGWNYVKKQLNDNRDYIYDMDLQSAEAYVNSEYAVALTELEV